MATTANYDWPLPSPRGNQMEEVAKIATSLIAIDAKLKSAETALSTHKHKFTDLLERPTTLGGYGITDGMTSTEVAAAIQQAVSDLVNGSGAALDTLKELADALGNDPQFATTVSNALALRIRVDAAQSFSLAQKAQGRSNLDALGTVDKGKADGVASLDGSGKVPVGQLPAMNYLPLAGGTLSGALQIQTAGNKVIRFLRADSTRAAALFANPDATPGFNIAVDDETGANTKTFGFGADGVFRSSGGIEAGAAQVATDGNIKGTRWGAGGVWLFDYLNSGNTRLGAFAFPRRSDGAAIEIRWSGQPGQPSWLLGGNGDGTVFQVWDPKNFSVNYANSTWNAERLQGWDIPSIQNDAQARADGAKNEVWWRARDYLLGEDFPVGTVAMCKIRNSTTFTYGQNVGGGDLLISNAGSLNGAQVNYGTWRVVSSSVGGSTAGLVKRIA